MKKLIMIGTLCVAGLVFAQENVPTPEMAAPPADGPKCECPAGKPCDCQKPCKCGEEMPKARRGHHGRRGGRGEFRRPGEGGMQRGPGMKHPPMPKFKKCNCTPDCPGVIILPPNAEEGEPLFKLPGRPGFEFKGEGRGPQKPGCECKGEGRGPQKPGCPCNKGSACDCPKPEGAPCGDKQ